MKYTPRKVTLRDAALVIKEDSTQQLGWILDSLKMLHPYLPTEPGEMNSYCIKVFEDIRLHFVLISCDRDFYPTTSAKDLCCHLLKVITSFLESRKFLDKKAEERDPKVYADLFPTSYILVYSYLLHKLEMTGKVPDADFIQRGLSVALNLLSKPTDSNLQAALQHSAPLKLSSTNH